MDFFGLHITRNYLYAAQLTPRKGGKKQLVTYAKLSAPPYPLDSDSELDIDSFGKELGQVLKETALTTNKVLLALPESQVFTRVISLPRMSEKELKEAMKWEAGQYIPIPLEEVTYDYQVIDSDSQKESAKMDVLLVAAPLTLTRKFLKIVEGAGLRIVGMETESIAAARSLVGDDPSSTTSMIVMIGDEDTNIFIVKQGSIVFTRSITTGGDALVRLVSQELGIEKDRAQEYLLSYGLEESALEGRVMKVIKPLFDVIVSEIKRSLAYYTTHVGKDNIERLILAGQNAKVPGVLVYLASVVSLEVVLADPWGGISIPEKFKREELEEVGPEFAVALGLALKDL